MIGKEIYGQDLSVFGSTVVKVDHKNNPFSQMDIKRTAIKGWLFNSKLVSNLVE